MPSAWHPNGPTTRREMLRWLAAPATRWTPVVSSRDYPNTRSVRTVLRAGERSTVYIDHTNNTSIRRGMSIGKAQTGGGGMPKVGAA